jgi:RNA polymerase sigma factor (sigma-70 family)
MTTPSPHAHLTSALHESSEDLLRFFLRRLEREDAADALADVMTTAWRRVDALPEPAEEARMWLFGIARNVMLHASRGNVRRALLAKKLRGVMMLSSPSPAPDSGIEIRDAINRLDSDLAELIRLVHWDGFSLVEAAALLGMPASTARGRYQRAKEALREALSPIAK